MQNVTVFTHFLIRLIIFPNIFANAQDKIRFDSHKTTTKCDSYNNKCDMDILNMEFNILLKPIVIIN